jgi:hypothetical protein
MASRLGPASLLLLALQPPSASPPALPRPATELGQLQFFAGSWSCQDQDHRPSQVRVGLDLDGFWYSVRVEVPPTPEAPRGLRAQLYWGYDPALKQFVETGVDTLGGFGTEMSPGWQGDRMVWTGDLLALGERTEIRETFYRRATVLQHTVETRLKGAWSVVTDETCRRATP